jgi:hypothetical protein
MPNAVNTCRENSSEWEEAGVLSRARMSASVLSCDIGWLLCLSVRSNALLVSETHILYEAPGIRGFRVKFEASTAKNIDVVAS